ncbi:hypothetical protein ACTXT7_001196 [Hymenolepis weldensis]
MMFPTTIPLNNPIPPFIPPFLGPSSQQNQSFPFPGIPNFFPQPPTYDHNEKTFTQFLQALRFQMQTDANALSSSTSPSTISPIAAIPESECPNPKGEGGDFRLPRPLS